MARVAQVTSTSTETPGGNGLSLFYWGKKLPREPQKKKILTSVIDVSEGRIDEFSHVARFLRNVQQERDGVVPATTEVQQGLGETRLASGELWNQAKLAPLLHGRLPFLPGNLRLFPLLSS